MNLFNKADSFHVALVEKYSSDLTNLLVAVNHQLPETEFKEWYLAAAEKCLGDLGLIKQGEAPNLALVNVALRFLNLEVMTAQIKAAPYSYDWLNNDYGLIADLVVKVVRDAGYSSASFNDIMCVGDFVVVKDQETAAVNEKMKATEHSLGIYFMGAAFLGHKKAELFFGLCPDHELHTAMKMMQSLYFKLAIRLFPLEYLNEIETLALWSVCEVATTRMYEVSRTLSSPTVSKLEWVTLESLGLVTN